MLVFLWLTCLQKMGHFKRNVLQPFFFSGSARGSIFSVPKVSWILQQFDKTSSWINAVRKKKVKQNKWDTLPLKPTLTCFAPESHGGQGRRWHFLLEKADFQGELLVLGRGKRSKLTGSWIQTPWNQHVSLEVTLLGLGSGNAKVHV